MNDKTIKRRLAAIMVIDAANFSRLMGDDEEGSLHALKAHRAEAIDPRLSQYNGRIVKTTGDGLIAEFGSAIDAVRCGVEIQRDVGARNRDVPAEKCMEFRIGINLGDVIVDQDDLIGDGVNVAHRVQAASPPGSVCVTGSILEPIKRTANMLFEDLGEHQFKNISEPVRLYRVAGDRISNLYALSPAPKTPARVCAPASNSIAVLPFVTLSEDRSDQYFADGLAEDILTELARFHALHVISRNASFVYRGQAVDMRKIGRELAVRYVVEGSVRRGSERVRVTVQLIDTQSGNHVWAEKYDRQIKDIFTIQDEIVHTVVATIAGRVEAAQMAELRSRPRAQLEAYDHLLRGLELHRLGGVTRADCERSTEEFASAMRLDPTYARAHAMHACSIATNWWDDDPAILDRSLELAQKALELDPSDAEAHRIMGSIHLKRGNFDLSRHHHTRAIELNPNDAYIRARSALFWIQDGQPAEALAMIEHAERLDPFMPDYYRELHGIALYFLDRCDEAAIELQKLLRPGWHCLAYLSASLTRLGNQAATGQAVAATLRVKPNFTIAWFDRTVKFRDLATRQHILVDMQAAGLPA